VGERKTMEEFVEIINTVFPLNVKSKLLENRNPNDGKFHIFIDLNPFAVPDKVEFKKCPLGVDR
jgi:hypothetical protein